jgi:hypothetical protein
MQRTEVKSPQLVRPGPIGLGIRVILGATVLYWFAALLTKWSGFVERDPIESGRLYTLLTIWWLPEVFALTFRRPWGRWPAVVFVAGGGAIGLAGYLTEVDLRRRPPGLGSLGRLVPGRHLDPKPRVRARRAPLAPRGRHGWAAPRSGCAVGLDRLDAWEASRKR